MGELRRNPSDPEHGSPDENQADNNRSNPLPGARVRFHTRSAGRGVVHGLRRCFACGCKSKVAGAGAYLLHPSVPRSRSKTTCLNPSAGGLKSPSKPRLGSLWSSARKAVCCSRFMSPIFTFRRRICARSNSPTRFRECVTFWTSKLGTRPCMREANSVSADAPVSTRKRRSDHNCPGVL